MRMKKGWSDKRELQFLINNVSRMERSNSAKALLLLALLVGQPASTTVSTVSGHQSDSTKSFRKLLLRRWCDDRAMSYIHQTPLRVLYRIGSRSIIALGSVEVWWTRDQAYIWVYTGENGSINFVEHRRTVCGYASYKSYFYPNYRWKIGFRTLTSSMDDMLRVNSK